MTSKCTSFPLTMIILSITHSWTNNALESTVKPTRATVSGLPKSVLRIRLGKKEDSGLQNLGQMPGIQL